MEYPTPTPEPVNDSGTTVGSPSVKYLAVGYDAEGHVTRAVVVASHDDAITELSDCDSMMIGMSPCVYRRSMALHKYL